MKFRIIFAAIVLSGLSVMAVSPHLDGVEIDGEKMLTVAVPGFLAEGGDLYDAFPEGRILRKIGQVSDVIIAYFSARDSVAVPPRGASA